MKIIVAGLFAIVFALGVALGAPAGGRGSFPRDTCPGEKCPDNAQPKDRGFIR